MVEIIYQKVKTVALIDLKKLADGYYLLKSKGTKNKAIMSKTHNIIQVHNSRGLSYITEPYINFLYRYEILGKIKDFTITNIELGSGTNW